MRQNFENPRASTLLLVLILSLLLHALSACGPAPHEGALDDHRVTPQSQFYRALLDLPSTESYSVSRLSLGQAVSCDSARHNFWLSHVLLNQSNLGAIHDQCMQLFQCTNEGRAQLDQFSNTGLSYRLTVTDFRKLPGSPPFASSAGLFVVGSDRIFFQEREERLMSICGTILHELVHRHDGQVGRNGESLAAEFPAYYAQFLFEAQARAMTSGFGLRVDHLKVYLNGVGGQRVLLTRQSLAQWISEQYGLAQSPREWGQVASTQAPFPWESSVNDGEPTASLVLR